MVDLKVGDRVKVTHRPEHDSEGECRRWEYRKALDGCEVEIGAIESDGDLWGAHPAGGAYFRPDELTPVAPLRAAHVEDVKTITGAALPPIGAHVRPKGGLHAGRTLRVMQHRGGEMLAEKGPWIGWYGPDAVEVLVTDPDGLPVEPAVPPVERRCGDGEHVRSITASAAALDRAATHWKRESSEAKQAIDGWVARCDTLRAELATEREARQAADVLARQLGEAANHAQIGEGAARMQLSRVAAAVSVVRAAWGGMVKSEVDAALAALDRALAGVPAPVEAAVPLGDAADLAALIAKVEADPLHNRGGVVSSALLVDVLRAVERRLVAVETRRPKVGPWTSPGMLHDAAGGTVASVWPCPGGWGWVANRPHLGPLNDTAETEDGAKAAVLAVLSTWCDVVDAPEPREP